MNSICYLANSFPEASEAYVSAEILELRRRGLRVLPCGFRKPRDCDPSDALGHGTIYVFPLRLWTALVATWMCISKFRAIAELLRRALQGPEPLERRLRTLLHTWLGAYLAVILRREGIGAGFDRLQSRPQGLKPSSQRPAAGATKVVLSPTSHRTGPDHIHVHHGFFASWCGMVAARLLGVEFSMTLHGSDLLVRADHLDCKLQHCRFCFTVSDYNRNYILDRYPSARNRVAVHRMGIDISSWRPRKTESSPVFTILNVGRLHPVKNQTFLVLACRSLKTAGVPFRCNIAGEGEERERLRRLINELGLQKEVHLLGKVDQAQLRELYAEADVVVLTSHSEGIPLVLMEAMAMEHVVLAPAITGIPELITSGETGFLYQPGSMDDLLAKLTTIHLAGPNLDRLRRAARRHIERNYDGQRNVAQLADDFLERVMHGAQPRASQRETDADSLLQQIQLRV